MPAATWEPGTAGNAVHGRRSLGRNGWVRGIGGWLCRLCCCCCEKRTREKSPLLSTGGGRRPDSGVVEPTMSQLQVMASADGQSETQKVEMTVLDSSHDEDDSPADPSPPHKEDRESRATSVASRDPPPRNPAVSTTFVRGSSGRSSWRMVPHPKRQSQISIEENAATPPAEDPQPVTTVTTADTETSEARLELVDTEPDTIPTPPQKDYTLISKYEDDQSEPSGPEAEAEAEAEGETEAEAEGQIVHTSSFSFSARDGHITKTH